MKQHNRYNLVDEYGKIVLSNVRVQDIKAFLGVTTSNFKAAEKCKCQAWVLDAECNRYKIRSIDPNYEYAPKRIAVPKKNADKFAMEWEQVCGQFRERVVWVQDKYNAKVLEVSAHD